MQTRIFARLGYSRDSNIRETRIWAVTAAQPSTSPRANHPTANGPATLLADCPPLGFPRGAWPRSASSTATHKRTPPPPPPCAPAPVWVRVHPSLGTPNPPSPRPPSLRLVRILTDGVHPSPSPPTKDPPPTRPRPLLLALRTRPRRSARSGPGPADPAATAGVCVCVGGGVRGGRGSEGPAIMYGLQGLAACSHHKQPSRQLPSSSTPPHPYLPSGGRRLPAEGGVSRLSPLPSSTIPRFTNDLSHPPL